MMSDLTPHSDPEMNEFEQALLRSVKQAMNGEYARVSTPADILARRRARGPGKKPVKVQTAIRFDPDVLAALKSTGRGWQTRVNEVMKEWVAQHAA
jgi:uncharacterized protein (DUF4415 family)